MKNAGSAWYSSKREQFLVTEKRDIVAELTNAASADGWHIERQQHEEWSASVGILQKKIKARVLEDVEILKMALKDSELELFTDVVLEYDFRRRGLRIDCVLLAPGVIAVLEFKRSKLLPVDADQVTNYCINLIEFHKETRRLCEHSDVIVVPILVQTEGSHDKGFQRQDGFHAAPWDAVIREPLRSDAKSLSSILVEALKLRRGVVQPQLNTWLSSPFSPSSTILDAAISLFGDHDVSAIEAHAGSVERIDATTGEIARCIENAQSRKRNHIILISGAPGAGKTLVGLRLAFDKRFSDDTVFVTGNAPLVEVLSQALKDSYIRRTAGTPIAGYPRESAKLLIDNSIFKIVKAHHFLGERGKSTTSADGRIVIFDEAQRTYEKGRRVAGHALEDHEADLILKSLEESYESGIVVVALLGHNQAINNGERGAIAWLEAADRRKWSYCISDDTLALSEFENEDYWRNHLSRATLESGHLSHSMRFYRNKDLESWVSCIMADEVSQALSISRQLTSEGHHIRITRDLDAARSWARSIRVGHERCGLIASSQAKRLVADGLYVGQKPSIADWMLLPRGDIRSSNMLESVQSQFQIQGLELDYTIVCWDADLRRCDNGWVGWKVSGSKWQRDNALDVAKNRYRVLLTRARKGMVVFVPMGDETGEDETRHPDFYDGIVEYLVACGAKEW